MAIRKHLPSVKAEIKINEIIQKGGSVKGHVADHLSRDHRLTLRIPFPLKVKIDDMIDKDPACPSLTYWILESIKQRIQKEKNDLSV